MNTINRTAIVVPPRKPFLEWASGIDANAPAAVTITDFTSVYLVNEADEYEPEELTRRHSPAIFVELLSGWYRDEERWPAPRREERFHKWFDARVVGVVWDLGRGRIIAED